MNPETTETHLARENERLRARVAELEAWNKECEQAAEAFRKSGETFRKLFDHSNDGIFIVDPRRDQIVDVNHKACELLGYSAEELFAMPMSAVHPDDAGELRALANPEARQGQGWTREVCCVTRSRRKLPTEISVSIIEMSARTYLIALVRDITERKRAEAEIRKANRRMRADLEAAARIQRSLLPRHSPLARGVRLAWEVKPCEELGGDVLNVVQLDDDHLGFYVLDVSGHGVKAAMLSVALHRTLSLSGVTSLLTRPVGEGRAVVSPAEVCEQLNSLFPMDPLTQQYFTLLYGVLDLRTRELRFTSAGQCAPIHLRPDGTAVHLETYGFPIGVVPDPGYVDHVVRLEPTSRLFVHSDGLTDAFDGNGEAFGAQGVLRAVEAGRGRPLHESLQDVVDRALGWGCDTCPRDDISILAMEVRPD